MSKQGPWQNDLLGRKTDAEYLYHLIKTRADLRANAGSIVINVDAAWGQGKSYFLENMYRDVLRREHPAITIDAWKYDFVDDPYTYVMAELNAYFNKLVEKTQKPKTTKDKALHTIKAVQNNAGKLLWTGLKGAAKRASRYVVAEGADEMVEIIEQYAPDALAEEAKGLVDDAGKQVIKVSDEIITSYIKRRLDDFSETKDSLENFRENLSKLINLMHSEFGMQLPMFVFVDELDRCRPTYAIQMLERIKHLFDIPNLAFVIATDTTSLSHSIKAVYGSEFRSREYLGRFFGRTYRLARASRHDIIYNMIRKNDFEIDRWSFPKSSPNLKSICEFIDITSQKFDMSIRQTEQSVNLLLDITFANYQGPPLEICFIYVLICQFITEGTLNGGDWGKLQSKIKAFGSDWGLESPRNNSGYYIFLTRIREYSISDLRDALDKAESVLRGGGDAFAQHFYDRIREQYNSKIGSKDFRSDWSKYYDYINIAKNGYVDDLVDEQKAFLGTK